MRCGLNRRTGEVLTGWDECAQSIGMIVTTAIGALVLARDFGSNAPALVDRPMNRAAIFDHIMAIAEALARDEPGFRLTRVNVLEGGADGHIVFETEGVFFPLGHLGDFALAERRSAAIGPLTLATLIEAA